MRFLLALVVIALVATACGDGESTAATSTPRDVGTFGSELFAERVIGGNPGCVTCHSLEPGVTLVGPSLHSVASPVPGLGVSDYVRQSILDPDGYLGPGFSSGQMPGGWGDLLTVEQIESLVEFLVAPADLSE